jgi:hypothetical protein
MSNVTIVMPHKDTPDWLRLSAKMWLAQKEEPLLLVVDTGSTRAGWREAVEEVGRHPRAEVAYLGPKWKTPHVWDMISVAHDYGLARCQTEFIMTTHTDVFPRHRGAVSYMRGLCGVDSLTPHPPSAAGARLESNFLSGKRSGPTAPMAGRSSSAAPTRSRSAPGPAPTAATSTVPTAG